jgi:hypothetical protein
MRDDTRHNTKGGFMPKTSTQLLTNHQKELLVQLFELAEDKENGIIRRN